MFERNLIISDNLLRADAPDIADVLMRAGSDDIGAARTGKAADGKDHPKAAELVGKPRPTSQAELGAELKKAYEVRDAGTLTGCSMCHR